MRREGSFPLSPLQQAIYLAVLAERSDALHVTQSAWELSGPLDEAALVSAWEAAVARHPGLRTAIDSSNPEDPFQLVAPDAKVLIEHREIPDGELEIATLFADERASGLDLSQSPAFRLSLFRVDPDRHVLIWTYSHLLVDGWSAGIVLDDVTSNYRSLTEGEAPVASDAGSFQDYVEWLATLDVTEAELFWAEVLAGRSGPTPLPTEAMLQRFASPERDAGTPPFFSCVRTLDADLTGSLAALARETGVTLSTVVQGGWALLLGAASGSSDVVFGVITAGRPFELERAETTVGMFSDAVPFRTELPENDTLSGWLREAHRRQGALLTYQHLPPAQLPGWKQIVREQPLFHAAIGFQNQPSSELEERRAAGLVWEHLSSYEPPQYPLHLTVDPGRELTLHLGGDTRWFEPQRAEGLLTDLVAILRRMTADASSTIGSITAMELPERDRAWADRRAADERHVLDVSGFRTTAEELEAILEAVDGIASAAIVPSPKRNAVDAFAVPASGRDLGVLAVRAFMAARVPAFLVPRAIHPVESLPSVDGVLDRDALGAVSPATVDDPPRTETEQTLAELWAEVLGLEHVGIHDNFFELGGESLAAMLIASRGEAELGSALSMKMMLELQTVAAVAEAVDRG